MNPWKNFLGKSTFIASMFIQKKSLKIFENSLDGPSENSLENSGLSLDDAMEKILVIVYIFYLLHFFLKRSMSIATMVLQKKFLKSPQNFFLNNPSSEPRWSFRKILNKIHNYSLDGPSEKKPFKTYDHSLNGPSAK